MLVAQVVETKLPKRNALIGGPYRCPLAVACKVRPRIGDRVALHCGRAIAVAALALVLMTPKQIFLADEYGKRIENLEPAERHEIDHAHIVALADDGQLLPLAVEFAARRLDQFVLARAGRPCGPDQLRPHPRRT